ncbi:MAG: cytochrome c3 family protein [Desulfurivibrionaceae bacterium]|nr:cytochrome c3 family protein [Desulfobulbales bacterium]MDT8334607.1 cytochrome c3 family protein [Desulfurivibrionaceae bacterium]
MTKRWLFILPALLVLPAALHAGMDMGGMVFEVKIRTEKVGTVTFDHTRHGADCNQCHPKIFKKKNNSNHATMKAMEKGRSCGACHNGKKAFTVAENCATCHAGDIVYRNPDAGAVTFPHTVHIEMFGCEECHPELFKARRGANKATMAEMQSGASCGACHDGSAAFGVADDCESCHAM